MLLFPLVKKPRQQFSVEVGGTTASTANGNQYTFNSVNAGTAATGRRVLVAYAFADNGTATALVSATINGNAATPVHELGGATQACSGFIIAQVDTGSTVNIVLNGATNAWQACRIQVYAIHGLSSNTPADTGGATGTTGTSVGDTIDCPAGGVVFGVVAWRDTADVDTSWTGLATEDADEYDDNILGSSFAHEVFSSAQTGLSVSAGASQAPLRSAVTLVSFGP